MGNVDRELDSWLHPGLAPPVGSISGMAEKPELSISLGLPKNKDKTQLS